MRKANLHMNSLHAGEKLALLDQGRMPLTVSHTRYIYQLSFIYVNNCEV